MNFRTPIQAELKRFDEAFPLAFSTKVPLMDLILRYAVKKTNAGRSRLPFCLTA